MTNLDSSEARLLVVDDQEPDVRLLERILKANGRNNYRTTTNSRDTFRLCAEFRPDLIMLDIRMPGLDGLGVLEGLKSYRQDRGYVPVVVLTADFTPETRQKALSSGATDFLSKPLDAIEVELRVKNLLETSRLYHHLQRHNEQVEKGVRERTRELARAQTELLHRLAVAAEYRDDDTGHHIQRVGNLAALLGQALGQSRDEIALLRLAAGLHDIGKIGVPDRVLVNPGIFTPADFEIMKSHTVIGGEILKRSAIPALQLARQIALHHHERWDGSGYPQQLAGEQIPLAGRIVAIADVFDALTHERPYKRAWSVDKAIAYIREQSGRHFDPKLVAIFTSVVSSQSLQDLAAQIEQSEKEDVYMT
jgi:putative two-component system response regulator